MRAVELHVVPEDAELRPVELTREELHFSVAGDNREELVEKARAIVQEYFGCADVDLQASIDVEPHLSSHGFVLGWTARVSAGWAW